jgi:cytochrome c
MTVAKSKIFTVAFVLLVLAVATRDAMALSAPERRGRTLAVRLCAQCHAVGKVGTSPHIGAPPFRHLEERVDLDKFQQRLRQGLMSSHRNMPAAEVAKKYATPLKS